MPKNIRSNNLISHLSNFQKSERGRDLIFYLSKQKIKKNQIWFFWRQKKSKTIHAIITTIAILRQMRPAQLNRTVSRSNDGSDPAMMMTFDMWHVSSLNTYMNELRSDLIIKGCMTEWMMYVTITILNHHYHLTSSSDQLQRIGALQRSYRTPVTSMIDSIYDALAHASPWEIVDSAPKTA